jgi:hypothetical protein
LKSFVPNFDIFDLPSISNPAKLFNPSRMFPADIMFEPKFPAIEPIAFPHSPPN